MPIIFKRKLHPTGDKRQSRSVIVPKEWWSSPDPPVQMVKMTADRTIILSPEFMSDEDLIECVLFILKQQFSKEQTLEIFQRVFGIKVEEGEDK